MDSPVHMEVLIKSVYAGMEVVKADQGLQTTSRVKTDDDTLVTPTDIRSQRAMLSVLASVSGVDIIAEESSAKPATSRYAIYVDPLDGTGAFAGGLPTSTCLTALYDRQYRRVLSDVVGEAVSGRVLYADTENPTRLIRPGSNLIEVGQEWREIRNSPLKTNQYVYLDVAHPFKSGLNNVQMAKFLGHLIGAGIKFHVPGSNGLIQAVVANGALIAAGSVSTAKGGPYDFCGALLVVQAGGFCRGYRWHEGKLIECDGLDPVACDMLVTANSTAILETLSSMLVWSTQD